MPLARQLNHAFRNKFAAFKPKDTEMSWKRPQMWLRQEECTPRRNTNVQNVNTHGVRKLNWLRQWSWEMARSTLKEIETRSGIRTVSPFFDPGIWEWVVQLSPSLLRGSRTKLLQRNAMQTYLPRSVFRARETASFDGPIEFGLGIAERAFACQLFEESSHLADLRLIEPNDFLTTLRQFQESVASSSPRPCGGSHFLWRTIAAEMWLSGLSGSMSEEVARRL